MGVNCKPGQMAWINIPRTRANLAIGLDQLQGCVVKTVSLHPEAPATQPAWIVTPPQSVRVPAPFDCQHGHLRAGDVLGCDFLPDEYLRPFGDLPPEDLQQRHHERELVS